MNARPKKKLCWNCEGSVSLKAETCPYCGVSVVGLSSDISSDIHNPPYRLVNPAQESPIPVSPYAENESEESDEGEPAEDEAGSEASAARTGDAGDDSKRVVVVLTLLATGSIFFIFGFALLLFSEEGYLSLHWNAGYWFVYLLLALPMLFFGFRKLNALENV